MNGFDFADAKRQLREVVHDYLAVSAVYYDPVVPRTPITVRFHTKLAMAGALEGGYGVEVIEGINKLVFSAPELLAARDGLGLFPVERGIVIIEKYDNAAFRLESQAPSDGPQNVYWTVSLVQPGQTLPTPPTDDSVYLTADDGTIITL